MKTHSQILKGLAQTGLLLLGLLFAGCASPLSYRYRPHLTAPGADIVAALTIAGGNEAVDGNDVTLLENGDATFESMLDAIRKAQSSVHLETYIFRDGQVGRSFVAELAERARAGVHVCLLLDGLGSTGFGGENEELLKAAGAQVVFFNSLQLKNLGKVHLRTHRKVLIVDGSTAFTGGVCIDDAWMGNADDPDHWRDTMVKIQGPVVRQMQAGFARAWIEATSEVLLDHALFPKIEATGPTSCQVMESVPGFHGNPARLSFLLAVASAHRSISITNAYFVPDSEARRALVVAAKRGVRVRLLLPSRRTDSHAVHYAGRIYYARLLKAGVEIWEYEPCRLHAKTMVVDGRWATVGSMNLDRRSFFWNYETNLNVFATDFAGQMERMFEQDLTHANRIDPEAWKRRPRTEKFAEFFYGLLRSQY